MPALGRPRSGHAEPGWCFHSCVCSAQGLRGPRGALGLQGDPDVAVRPGHTAGPLSGGFRTGSRGASADRVLLPRLLPRWAAWASCLLLGGPGPPQVSCWRSQSPPSTWGTGWPVRFQDAHLGGRARPGHQTSGLKYLPKNDPEHGVWGTNQGPVGAPEAVLGSPRQDQEPWLQAARAVTSRTCTCSRPGRSRRAT